MKRKHYHKQSPSYSQLLEPIKNRAGYQLRSIGKKSGGNIHTKINDIRANRGRIFWTSTERAYMKREIRRWQREKPGIYSTMDCRCGDKRALVVAEKLVHQNRKNGVQPAKTFIYLICPRCKRQEWVHKLED